MLLFKSHTKHKRSIPSKKNLLGRSSKALTHHSKTFHDLSLTCWQLCLTWTTGMTDFFGLATKQGGQGWVLTATLLKFSFLFSRQQKEAISLGTKRVISMKHFICGHLEENEAKQRAKCTKLQKATARPTYLKVDRALAQSQIPSLPERAWTLLTYTGVWWLEVLTSTLAIQ